MDDLYRALCDEPESVSREDQELLTLRLTPQRPG
jgi:hypothetical protein